MVGAPLLISPTWLPGGGGGSKVFGEEAPLIQEGR